MSEAAPRPRILVLNQYYWPGVEATAHLLTELCEALASDYEVEVVTGVLHGHENEPHEFERNGVRIVRVVSTAYERAELGRRAANYLSYLELRALARAPEPSARSRPLHDGPADRRRRRRPHRPQVRRTGARHQPGRLPRDSDGARSTPQPGGRRRAAEARRRVSCGGRTGSSQSARPCVSGSR